MIVMKFGGTSVEDGTAIRRVCAIVHRRLEFRPVVVVSAMAGVTDQLLAMGNAAANGENGAAQQQLRRLSERHYDAVCELVRAAAFPSLLCKLGAHFKSLEELLGEIAAEKHLSPRHADLLMAFGEMLSSELITAAIQEAGLNAIHVDARQCVITNGCHTRAVPDFEASGKRLNDRLQPLLQAGYVPVLGGFIASSGEGVPTTLGRGGSDYSAAIIGAALEADRIEIWTDVPGIMTTDPNLCPQARLIQTMTFGEAAEIAYFGAKVLHPATLLPAIERNVPVYVMSSREPDGEGTRIEQHAPTPLTTFRAIAARRGVTIVNVAGRRMWTTRGFLRAVFAVFDRHDCAVDVVATTHASLSLAVDSSENLEAILADLGQLGEASCENRQAILCMVGEDIRGKPGIAAKVFGAVADAGINVRMISQGASEISISFVIEEKDVHPAVNRLHQEFFSEAEQHMRRDKCFSLESRFAGDIGRKPVEEGFTS